MAILAPGEHRWCESRKEHPEPEGKRPDWIAHLVPMRPQRLQRMARIAGNDGGQGFLDLGALLLARAQRGGEFGLFAVRPRGADLVIAADIAANHPEQRSEERRVGKECVHTYRSRGSQ